MSGQALPTVGTIARRLGQGGGKERIDARRQVGAVPQRRDRSADMLIEHGEDILTSEGWPATE